MSDAKCLHCEQDSNAVPLLKMEFRGQDYWICPKHVPLLIHKPEELVGQLPGAESMQAADDL